MVVQLNAKAGPSSLRKPKPGKSKKVASHSKKLKVKTEVEDVDKLAMEFVSCFRLELSASDTVSVKGPFVERGGVPGATNLCEYKKGSKEGLLRQDDGYTSKKYTIISEG